MTRPTPPIQPDCRLSNLVLEGRRSKCYRPKEHQGQCGEPITQTEMEDGILYGQCGGQAPTGILHAKVKTRW